TGATTTPPSPSTTTSANVPAAAANPAAVQAEPDAPDASGAPASPAAEPTGPTGPSGPANSVTVELNDLTNQPSTAIVVILGMTLLSVAPAVLLTCTSFTKILIVLGLTRNALGLQQTPPNQVLAGLALFLSLFVMSPVLGAIYDDGIRPYTEGTVTAEQAFEDGIEPLREFMLDNTDDDELALLTTVSKQELPANRADVPTTTLVPAFILTELKEAFTIGFLIFVPFLVIDMVVAGALMALGMMMMPPVMVSLPFKLLLFVLVDGWGLVIESLVSSYGSG
ncbi:MAG: flagellar type III secretion system pore protein FliP, partial [Candidatus Nanopelagicales bacterium]